MTTSQPPTTVGDLIARVTEHTGNIQKHRDAMTKVAANARTTVPQPPGKGVTK